MNGQSRKQLGVGHLKISDLAKQYVGQVLSSNRLSYGPFSRRFEDEFASIHGVKYAVLCNSGTSALQVALAALKERDGWPDGSEVIVPAITFVATANVALMLNLRPVFVDVDPKTYNLSPDQIEASVTSKTKAIMPVHMFGLPADMRRITKLAKKHGLRIVEDSCEAMFVESYGKPVGSHGDIGCFSTYVAHLLVTGVGGLAITNDAELAIIMRSLCNHGRDGIYLSIDDDEGKSGSELELIVKRRFNFVRLGYSYRVTEVEAALGLAQLRSRKEIFESRQQNASYLIKRLRPLEAAGLIQLPSIPSHAEHAFMLFPIVVRDSRFRRDDITFFLEECGIETRPMMPLINQPLYVGLFGDLESRCPVARWINDCGFYIGCHDGFGMEELDYIVDRFNEWFKAAITTATDGGKLVADLARLPSR